MKIYEVAEKLAHLSECIAEFSDEISSSEITVEVNWDEYPNFKSEEFACPCGCGNSDISNNLLVVLQFLRSYYGKPVNVTSGFRCEKYNATLKNAIATSDHLKGNAADIQIPGITDTQDGRIKLMNLIDAFPFVKYSYCNGLLKYKGQTGKSYSAPLMGKSVHISVK